MKGSTWNRADGSSPEQPPIDSLSPRPLGTRARDFRTGPAPRSTWNPTGIGRGHPQVRIGGVRTHGLTQLTVTGLRCIEHAGLEIPPGVAPGCGDHGSGTRRSSQCLFPLWVDRFS